MTTKYDYSTLTC